LLTYTIIDFRERYKKNAYLKINSKHLRTF
jgi:hypothetical protein